MRAQGVLRHTGWRRCIGCLKLHVSFRKRATNYRALWRKMTYQDKASYASSPPCTNMSKVTAFVSKVTYVWVKRDLYMCQKWPTLVSNVTYMCVKSVLHMCRKWLTHVSKLFYICIKNDLHMCRQSKHTYVGHVWHICRSLLTRVEVTFDMSIIYAACSRHVKSDLHMCQKWPAWVSTE